ncbi:MAG TPA: LAGLIDADG family homing endonuclease [Methylomirabilota bacterium]|nr:LAGLIDADG family homing endonuclease [Methylomirabilota bacterium]
MESAEYVTDAPVATSVHLAMRLRKPLLIEGHAGVGKTEVAKVMARMLGTNLIRLQCYEGLDAAAALYEWNYQKQLLHIKLHEGAARSLDEEEREIFSEAFLLRRPLLQAITQERPPVLLVDEVDRCVAGETLVDTTAGLKRAAEVEPGDEVISFDPVEFRMTTARVKKVVPREAQSLLRVLVGGRLLEVTPEHRFVRYTDSGYEVVRADELRRGDRLPLYKAPEAARVSEPEFEFPDDMIKLTDDERRMLHGAYRRSHRTYDALATAVGVSRGHLRNVLQPTPTRRSLRARVLAGLASEMNVDDTAPVSLQRLTSRVCQSVAFYELLGYIVADGCFTSDRVCISDKDRSNLETYAEKFSEAFGRAVRIVPGPHRNFELTCHSLPLGRFLHRVLGAGFGGSKTRRVPDFVFGLPREKRAGFVRGFFDGEGWVGDHQVAAVSSSVYLVVGLQHLLSSLGVDSHLTVIPAAERTYGGGQLFQLSVTDVAGFAAAIGFCAAAKQRLLTRPSRPRWSRTETLPRPRVVSALEDLRRRTILNGKASHQTVHDILAGRVRANVSSPRRIADAFDAPEVTKLLARGVVLGEVGFVERIEVPQTVYDFVLDGSPYFVGNQVVTHNCDEEFEAFMLEVFSDWQVTIPEIGTIKATHPPYVILTSNRTRELSDALRRRCLYLWIDYPPFDKELRIVERKVPGINARLAAEIARFMERLRQVRLAKVPGVAETLDWAQALAGLHADHLDEALVTETLGCILKDADDIKRFRAEVGKAGLAPFLQSPA